MQITNTSAAVASQLPAMPPARGVSATAFANNEPSPSPSLRGRGIIDGPSLKGTGNADALREAFTQFVGETFFGQMVKSMRAMTDKPAYFHGGRAEEAFQSQLDQKLAEHLTEASADRFAEPMFERQFPHLAKEQPLEVNTLTALRRF